MISHLIQRKFGLSAPLTRDITVQRDLRVPMPDGVDLLADRWMPRSGRSGGGEAAVDGIGGADGDTVPAGDGRTRLSAARRRDRKHGRGSGHLGRHPRCPDRIQYSTQGPSRRLVFPLGIEGSPLFWERIAEAAGSSSSPVWTLLT
ncbi:hypothetical protein ALI22I_00350 [Saccharothrix sp. ALI-22-I]|uniref:hypothetical protein n=1 Tax=Saccharothrix sp. ALI-22-I TaxID=1933778 RepID=UPI00097C30C4|nr:hypothetical protein [Saccharothrix sp. ALI-22-I]ONI93058.1 hypothetical protein ALI22I_00350 [Saccharothrix sp. ALI-22-I]